MGHFSVEKSPNPGSVLGGNQQRGLSQAPRTQLDRRAAPSPPLTSGIYTFWHYKRMRWQRDAGLRLDHLLLSANLRDRLEDAGVDREVRGLEGASDHVPVCISLRRRLRGRRP